MEFVRHANQSLSYRPEIDGLRAVSVLGVIFFHFGLGFPGGYVGVDVFFVISGFLITSIIHRELSENRFSIANFWVRRIRRILPAACFLTLSTILLGLWILDAPSLLNLGRSAVAHCLMVSNYFFWSEAGYFSESAEMKPLLHTWSLSVEEQFYLGLPILMILVYRFLPRLKIPILVALLLFSLCLCIVGTKTHPEAAFYFLPTRAWELLAGSLVALTVHRISLPKRVCEACSAASILAILASMFLFRSTTPFPGTAALLPVFASCLFLISNSGKTTVAGTILSSPPFVLIGLMSYSLYLWHWPLVTFAHHLFIELNLLHSLVLLLMTFILGAFSWKFIEIPFRESSRLRKKKPAFLFGAASSVFIAATASIVVSSKGFPGRFDDDTLTIMEDVQWTGTEFKESEEFPEGATRFGNSSTGRYDYVLWGDSHAMVLGPTFEKFSRLMDLSGIGLISPARPPVTGLWMPGSHPDPERIKEQSAERFRWVCEKEISHIILVGRWDAMCAGEDPALSSRFPGKDPKRLMVSDGQAPISATNSTAALTRQFGTMLTAAEEHGVKIWVLLQVPEVVEESPARDFLLAHRFPFGNSLPGTGSISRRDYLERRSLSENVFRSFSSPNLRILDPVDRFFPGSDLLQIHGERSFYRDRDHLTREGVSVYLAPMIEDVLSQIRNEKPSE